MEGAKEIVRLSILQYVRQPTSYRLCARVIHLIPNFARAMLIYTNFEEACLHD